MQDWRLEALADHRGDLAVFFPERTYKGLIRFQSLKQNNKSVPFTFLLA